MNNDNKSNGLSNNLNNNQENAKINNEELNKKENINIFNDRNLEISGIEGTFNRRRPFQSIKF